MIKIAKNSIKYLIVITLLSVVLYPKFPLFFVPNSTVAIRLEDVVIAITVIVWTIANIADIKKFINQPVYFSIIVFFIVGLISVLSGAYLTQTLTLPTGLLHWARRIEYIALFVVASTSIRSKEDLSFIFKAIIVVFVYIFLYGLGQKYFNLPVITTQNSEYSKGIALFYLPGGHLVSTFAGHYDMASFITLFSPLLYLALFAPKSVLRNIFGIKKVLISRAIIFLILTCGLWLLVHAASRISIVSYMGVSVFSLILVKKYKYIPVVIIAILLFINLSSNLMTRYMNIFNVAIEKVISLEESLIVANAASPEVLAAEDRSTSIRLNVEWPRAIRAFQKNPALGTGYSSISLATDNDYLRSLGETGILGTTSLFLIFGFVFERILSTVHKIKKINLEKIFLLAIIAAMPGVLLNMVFIDILEASKFAIIFWMFLGIGYSITRNYEN